MTRRTDADSADATYTVLTSMQHRAGLSPPPASAGHVAIQGNYNFPNIRWGVKSISRTTITRSYTPELREGGRRVVAPFAVNGLAANGTRSAPNYERPSPTARVAVCTDNQRCLTVGSPSTLM